MGESKVVNKKRGLNKGLEVLLKDVSADEVLVSDACGSNQQLLELELSQIKPSNLQPRQNFALECLQELAESIKKHGILQPLIVRANKSGGYDIIAGERRFRAAAMAGLKKVPVIIKALPDDTARAVALIENIQRENLTPLEEARAFDALLKNKELDLTHVALGEALGKSRVYITNALRLLHLTPEVQELLESKKLDVGHAKVLLSLGASEQVAIAHKIIAAGLSVRATERLVEESIKYRDKSRHNNKIKAQDSDVERLARDLSLRLGAKVEIIVNDKGRGKVVMHYTSLDELDGILEHIK